MVSTLEQDDEECRKIAEQEDEEDTLHVVDAEGDYALHRTALRRPVGDVHGIHLVILTVRLRLDLKHHHRCQQVRLTSCMGLLSMQNISIFLFAGYNLPLGKTNKLIIHIHR